MRKIDLEAEKKYENLKAENPSVRFSQLKYYYAITPEFQKFENKIKKIIENSLVLEIGCSDGGLAEKLAPFSQNYIGVDISDVAINIARNKNIKNATFVVKDVHHNDFKENSFDVVIASGVLHHLDLEIALNAILRLLKPNGLLVAKEPLGVNPIINIYRRLTPKARTHDERPLKINDLMLFQSKFLEVDLSFVGFFSLISVFIKNDNLREFFLALDRKISKTFLRFYFWFLLGIWKKSKR